jgi:CHAD domain-containing protein
MTTEVRETEQKYEGAPGIVLPSLAGLPRVARVSGPESETLTAEYFDTGDYRLLRAGVTLRRRDGGTDAGWHLKLPDPEHAATRRELRLPLDRTGDPVPEELAYLVMVHTRHTPLRPVARIETHRRRTTLHDTAGESLAEVVADEVAAQSLGASTAVSRWDEIEVELTGGSRKLLRAADKRLRDAGVRPAGRATKLERALPVDLPTPRDGIRLTHGSPAGDVVLSYLATQKARLMSLDPAVRQDEPDAVHQMRVTTRRLRSALQAFREIVRADATRQLRDELKRFGQVLGDAREEEVLSEHLRAGLTDTPPELVMGPAQARIRAHFAPRQAAARAAVLQMLDSPAYFAMLDELDRLLAAPPLTSQAARPAGKVLPGTVARSYLRTKRRMRRALRAPAGPSRDVALHDARKAAKRARYAAEAARPASGKKARRFAKRMKSVQSVLGDHQDAVSARAVARELGVHAQLAGESAFSFGLLHERAHRDAQDHQVRGRRAWKRATRGKVLGWLT